MNKRSRYNLTPEDKVVVLTGAGISAESNLHTFRDSNGLWEQYRIEDVATPAAFERDPATVWNFYRQMYLQLKKAKPNPGHYALVELELFLQDNFILITQNVDGLHYRAGSRNILKIHGSLGEVFCVDCSEYLSIAEIDLDQEIPLCSFCGGFLRPAVVWFGEIPYHLERIDSLLFSADYFLVVGTSGSVYPAAQFLQIARHYGATTIGINLEEPDNVAYLDEFHQGRSGEILPQLIREWTGKNA